MKLDVLHILRCPACGGRVQARPAAGKVDLDEGGLTCSGCSRSWPVLRGIPQVVFPEELEGEEARSRRLWDRIAPLWGALALATDVIMGMDSAQERRQLVDRLEVPPDGTVLEVAAGNGRNLEAIAGRIGANGSVFGVDLSPQMLKKAADRLRHIEPVPELFLGNSANLPFADSAFDAVLDGFGMKYYSDKRRAMEEMLRVVKPGGKVVITELGLPSGKRRTVRQRLLLLWIPHFGEPPPEDQVPSEVEDVTVEWAEGEMIYTIEFRKPTVHGG